MTRPLLERARRSPTRILISHERSILVGGDLRFGDEIITVTFFDIHDTEQRHQTFVVDRDGAQELAVELMRRV